jgi:hypothetical protein
LFTRQRTRRTVTTQRTSATQLLGSFSAATELFGKVSSIQAAKTLLKGESAERREFRFDRELEKNQRPVSPRRILRENEPVSSQLEKSPLSVIIGRVR